MRDTPPDATAWPEVGSSQQQLLCKRESRVFDGQLAVSATPSKHYYPHSTDEETEVYNVQSHIASKCRART